MFSFLTVVCKLEQTYFLAQEGVLTSSFTYSVKTGHYRFFISWFDLKKKIDDWLDVWLIVINWWYGALGPWKDQHWRKGVQLLCPFSLEQPSTICPFSHLECHLQKTSQNIPFLLGLPPIDTAVPRGPLMLRNSFNDFVFEHWSGCCATEPGYAGDIGALGIWQFWNIEHQHVLQQFKLWNF